MNKLNAKKLLPFFLTIICLLLGLFFIYRLLTYNFSVQDAYRFDTGWDITYRGEDITDKELDDVTFKNIKKGDTVVFKNNLPAESTANQTMIFNTYLASVEVLVDNKPIYQYATKNDRSNVIIGSGCHLVLIPEDSIGKDITIKVTAKQDNAFTNMETIFLVPTTTAYCYYIDQKIFGVFISIFLLVLGIVLSFTGAFSLILNSRNFQLTYIGIFSFFMGLWSMNNIKILQIFNINLGASTTSEYFSLFAATIPLLCLFASIRKDDSKVAKIGIRIIIAAFALFLTITSILHFTGLVHYSRSLKKFHVMVALTILFMFIISIRRKRKRTVSEIALSSGFFVLCASFAADIVRYNVQKYLFPNDIRLVDSFIPIGTLIFIILLLYSYICSALDVLQEKAHQELLQKIAYNDTLCDINNRAQCDKDFEILDKGTSNYALINMDLNGLKTINDTQGHAKGDILLKTFASIIEEAFKNVGSCYRMGGDEFLVIVKNNKISEIDAALSRMKSLEKEKSQELDFNIDAAYGIAERKEVPESTTAKVYTLADQRMYTMKQASKNKNS